MQDQPPCNQGSFNDFAEFADQDRGNGNYSPIEKVEGRREVGSQYNYIIIKKRIFKFLSYPIHLFRRFFKKIQELFDFFLLFSNCSCSNSWEGYDSSCWTARIGHGRLALNTWLDL